MSNDITIQFRLDPRSGVAPYRQLIEQVLRALEAGRLHSGDKLPSVRDVVSQVVLNPNTVHRAYRELEHLGVVESRSGLGTFVRDYVETGSEFSELRLGLQRWIAQARDEGLSDAALSAMWKEALSASKARS